MRLILDTADIEEISRAANTGLVSEVTINPTLLKKVGMSGDFERMLIHVKNISQLAQIRTINLQVTATTGHAIREEAEKVKKYFYRAESNTIELIHKVPLEISDPDCDALHCITDLVWRKIPVNVTLVCSTEQAFWVGRTGAYYASIFVGRINEFKEKEIVDYDGLTVLKEAAKMYRKQGFTTKILAASIRESRQVTEAAIAGAHAITMPPKVFWEFWEMRKNPVTTDGLARFTNDWNS